MDKCPKSCMFMPDPTKPNIGMVQQAILSNKNIKEILMRFLEGKEPPIVVNLFGGPGMGKTTTAWGVSKRLKIKRVNMECVAEYAKGLVWEERLDKEDQTYIFAKQSKHQKRCAKHVDVIVTDAPLLLSLYYGREMPNWFKEMVRDIFNGYNNMNYMIKRGDNLPYCEIGRTQTEEESNEIHKELELLLKRENVPFTSLYREDDKSQDMIESKIVFDVMQKLKDRNTN